MEGGIVYGLTAALKGEITIQNGRVVQSHFSDYQMVRHNEMPAIEVHIVPSTESAGRHRRAEHRGRSPARSSTPCFAATGKRVYKLPIKLA